MYIMERRGIFRPTLVFNAQEQALGCPPSLPVHKAAQLAEELRIKAEVTAANARDDFFAVWGEMPSSTRLLTAELLPVAQLAVASEIERNDYGYGL